jgi:hypothetical protein
MEFSINKNSTLPILKLSLINDGRHNFSEFYDKIQNANIFFTMTDIITGVKKIAKKPTTIELVKPEVNCVGDKYYIIYQFTEKDTANSGRYLGNFTIEFLDESGKLIVPICEDLYINILGGGIRK